MRYVAAMMMAASWPAMAQAQTAPAAPTAGTGTPAAAPSDAAASAAATAAESDEPDIIVRGSRNLPGSVVGDIPPEEQLGPADIRSYGVSTVSDLLAELAPQTTSGAGGAPVVLLNGKRISGFQEIRDIPTEAIARVDILPEEVALKYGYRADQRVVNIVLRRRFHSTTVELADSQATDGGRNIPQADLDLLTIRQGGRFNLHTKYTQSSALTESERNIAAAVDGGATGGITDVDQRPYRTLLPFSQTLNTNAVYARPIGGVSATINAEIQASNSVGQFGLPSVALTVPTDNPFAAAVGATSITRVLDGGDFSPLTQRNSALTAHLGTTLNGSIGTGWQWTVTGSYDRVHSETFTETGVDATAYQARLNANDATANPLGALTAADFAAIPASRAYSTSSDGAANALVNGSLFSLPAGAVSTAIRVGAETSDFTSSSYRGGVVGAGDVSRDTVSGRVNLDVPLTSRSKGVLPWLGTLSVNVNAEADHLSDFGTLTTIGYGINWAPIAAIRLIGSISDSDDAPTAAQLGNPNITTPNVRVFDYVTGTTATVTTLSGGNPDLVADSRHIAKLGLTLKPWSDKDINFTANYTDTRTDNPTASFPAATAAIEAAFPDRFTRDASGTLIRIDTRPINYARSESSQLRWGINFSKAIKSKVQKELEAFRAGTGPNPFAGMNFPGRPGGGDGGPPSGGRGGGQGGGGDGPGGGGPGGGRSGGGRGPGGFGGGGGRGQGGGRVQFAVYHTWHITDRVVVADGGPSLDLLNGDATGSGGGQARHEFEGQAGYSNNGLGARLSVNYATGTRVNGGTAAAPEPLSFGGLATADLRLFADLGQRLELVKAHPWIRGMRVTLSLQNVLNTRQRVTTAAGTVPVSYQPDYLDPLGRTVRLSIRKLFF